MKKELNLENLLQECKALATTIEEENSITRGTNLYETHKQLHLDLAKEYNVDLQYVQRQVLQYKLEYVNGRLNNT